MAAAAASRFALFQLTLTQLPSWIIIIAENTSLGLIAPMLN